MERTPNERIVPTTGRTNCGGRCVLLAHVREGKIERITTEHAGACPNGVPLTACARGLQSHRTFFSPERLLYPMKRVGERGSGEFRRISWQEAVDTIAREWIRIRDAYGVGSRYVHYATGIDGVLRGTTLAKRLLSLDGGYLDYYNSYSTACISLATELMYGTRESGSSPETWLDSKLIVLWGHNPAETKFDCETMYYLRKARARGIPVVVIDPRKSDTVTALDAEWLPVRPATDSALADAMAYTIWKENLHDGDFLRRFCVGFFKDTLPEGADPSDCVLSYLTGETDGVPKTPEWAENITGVPAEAIRSLAVRYASAKPAALIQGYGAQRHACGEQSARGAILLACMTGNVGIPGGWASGVADCTTHAQPVFPVPENPYGRKIPVYLWTDAIDRAKELDERDGVRGGRPESNIKMILNLAGNCLVNQHGDIGRTTELLRDPEKVELIVCSDLFLTPSARFADILLPGVSLFESENLTVPWKYGNFIGYNNRAVEPLGEGRFEYDWLSEVAEQLGLREAFTEGLSSEGWLRRIYDDLREKEPELPPLAELRRAGVYRYKKQPPVIAFRTQREDWAHNPFPTKSGKIELYSESVKSARFRDFFPAIPRYVEPPEGAGDPLQEKYPIQLIGWHTKRRCHSIHDNNPALARLEAQVLWLHPKDAEVRGIADGQEVLVFNDRGRLRIPVRITENILPGVAALSEGAWYRPDADGTDLAGSVNVLTSLHPTPYAHGNPQHTILVEIQGV